jgi:dihydroflavonol-4-reductase
VRVFITGGNGFIGSVVVGDLVRRGYEVVCLLRETSKTDRIDGLSFTRAVGDVCDVETVRAAIGDCAATIHLAAPGGWDADHPETISRVIEDGTRNVLDAARGLNGHRVVVVSSTAAIDGSARPRVFDERAPFTLRDSHLYYAHAKHKAELTALSAAARGVRVMIVNPSEVYGPNDTSLGTAGNLIDFATSSPVLVCRGGTSIVHVADVAAGIIGALERGRPGERYILGGENLTIRDLARLVLEIMNRRARIITVPRSIARIVSRVAVALRAPLPYNPHVVPYATRYWFVDSSKARRELGVSFRGARDTLVSTLTWLRERGYL